MKEISKEEIRKRKKDTIEFVDSSFFRNFFEPYIMNCIQRESNINGIKDESEALIVRSYIKQTSKRDLYRGLLNKIKEWAEKEYKN